MKKEQIIQYTEWIQNYLIEQGMEPFWATLLNTAVVALVGLLIVVLLDIITRNIIVQVFKVFSNKTKNTFDDFLVQSNFPRFVAHLVPWAFLWYIIPIIFNEYPKTSRFFATLAIVYLVVLSLFILRSILRSTKHYLQQTNERLSDKPLDSYQQVLCRLFG